MSGLSEVIGMMAETVFRKIVRDNRIVTPKKQYDDAIKLYGPCNGKSFWVYGIKSFKFVQPQKCLIIVKSANTV